MKGQDKTGSISLILLLFFMGNIVGFNVYLLLGELSHWPHGIYLNGNGKQSWQQGTKPIISALKGNENKSCPDYSKIYHPVPHISYD